MSFRAEKGSADKDGRLGAETAGASVTRMQLQSLLSFFGGSLQRYRMIPASWHHPRFVCLTAIHYQGILWLCAHRLASLVMLGEQYL
ncbi:hypothetical protein GDO81_020713 [Engystomops pustulosus]|uniref:Uncharacterized protein n=1 Tax=Engystomops pustulosus TaxID=76066 RepID=A0AAV6ZE23_ENGPU|nr:hypothetical protein GDO81_020713 [Engystomops pustulosus]